MCIRVPRRHILYLRSSATGIESLIILNLLIAFSYLFWFRINIQNLELITYTEIHKDRKYSVFPRMGFWPTIPVLEPSKKVRA